MWLYSRVRISQLIKKVSISLTNGKSFPYQHTQVVHAHQTLIPDTLLYRFFKFIGTSPKYKHFIPHSGNLKLLRDKFVTKYAFLSVLENDCFEARENRHTVQDLENLSLEELFEFIVFLSEVNVRRNSDQYKALLRAIDNVCFGKIPFLSIEDAVRVNYYWVGLVGTRVKLLKSFDSLMDSYIKSEKKSIQTPLAILMLFCTGIARKHPKAMEVVNFGVKRICNDNKRVHGLSFSETILISEVAFKTGVKLDNPTVIEHLVNTVSKDISKYAMDPAHFVVLVKALRHNRYHDWNLLKSIHKCLVEDAHILKEYSFAGITHLLALYADALYSDLDFMNFLITAAINGVSQQHVYNPFNEIGRGRAKDMDRLLWATSYLGLKIDEDIVEKVIMPIINEKIQSKVYKKQISVLISTVLSLWIMGYKPVSVLPDVFTEQVKKYLLDTNRVRYKTRLQLLSTCISVETPEAMNNINLEMFHLGEAYYPGEEKLVEHKPFLNEVVQDVRNAPFMSDSIDVICGNSLPYLNIPGITLSIHGGQKRHGINIEVLDSSNCLNGTHIPNGLMLLKLRLLRKLGYRTILVKCRDYENQKPEIMLQLEDEIMNMQ